MPAIGQRSSPVSTNVRVRFILLNFGTIGLTSAGIQRLIMFFTGVLLLPASKR
jgi:hypothetical protein